jgi:hypothetical protein
MMMNVDDEDYVQQEILLNVDFVDEYQANDLFVNALHKMWNII